MIDYFLIFLTITAQRTFDQNYLHGVKKGFEGSGIGMPWPLVLTLAALALMVILLLLVLARILRPSKYSFGRHKNDFITKASDIRDIIERSVMLRAVYDIEVYDDNYKEVYKGQVLGINNDRQLEAELSSFTDPNLDFREKNVHVAFRMSRRGRQEFYHFNTISRYIGITNNFGRRERSVRLVMPKRIEIGQKRRYLRVEPAGEFRFTVKLFGSSNHDKLMPLKSFFLLHEAEVTDISIGGLQTIIQGSGNEIKVKSGDIVYLRFKLPEAGLKVSNIPHDFFFKGHVIGVERLVVGRRVMSNVADERSVGPNSIRIEYTARGYFNQNSKQMSFRPASNLIFEDLSRWIQSYQRYWIQREKDTRSRPDSVKNLYPRKPLEVKSKYPQVPLRKGSEGPKAD